MDADPNANRRKAEPRCTRAHAPCQAYESEKAVWLARRSLARGTKRVRAASRGSRAHSRSEQSKKRRSKRSESRRKARRKGPRSSSSDKPSREPEKKRSKLRGLECLRRTVRCSPQRSRPADSSASSMPALEVVRIVGPPSSFTAVSRGSRRLLLEVSAA